MKRKVAFSFLSFFLPHPYLPSTSPSTPLSFFLFVLQWHRFRQGEESDHYGGLSKHLVFG